MHSETDEDADKTARLAAFDALMGRRDAARMEERHGDGRLFGMSGRPQRAEGCLLSDGTATDATVVALPGEAHRGGLGLAFGDVDYEDGQGADAPNATWRIDPEACVWSRRLAPDGVVARRGRLVVKPGVALRFVDAPEAGEGQEEGEAASPTANRTAGRTRSPARHRGPAPAGGRPSASVAPWAAMAPPPPTSHPSQAHVS